MSSDQTVKAFKLKCELEDELRFIELKNKNHSYMDGFRQIKKYISEGKFV